MISKRLVPENKRLDFLPRHFGNRFLMFENMVYSFMNHFCEDYSGGYWQFYTLSNGGAFMSLDSDKTFNVCNPMNYFDGKISAEAASIGVNIFALNALLNDPCDEKLIDLYYALKDFGAEHKEAPAILGFID